MSNFSIFSERKAAEAAAFLLLKGGGGLELLKLMKLMYLAERESFKKYGESITGDAFVSMQHGPVLSGTYDFAKAHSRVALAIGAKQEVCSHSVWPKHRSEASICHSYQSCSSSGVR